MKILDSKIKKWLKCHAELVSASAVGRSRNKFGMTLYAVIILFISIFSVSAAADTKNPPMPLLELSFWTTPFISDYSGHGIVELSGQTGGGFWIDKYSFLWTTRFGYESAAEHSDTTHNRCSFTITENFIFKVNIAKYFALAAETGLGYERFSIQSDQETIQNHDYFVLRNALTAEFPLPAKYVIPSATTSIDMSFGATSVKMKLQSFLRITALPYFDFINLFTDIGVCYEPKTPFGSEMPFFTYQTGIAIRLRLSQKKISRKIIPVVVPPNPPKPIEEKTQEEKKQQQQENYVELYQTMFNKKTVGNTVELEYINFSNQNDIGPNGLARLTALAAVLSEKKIVFAVGAYSDALGNADEEIALAQQRSRKIKNILISLGVPAENIKIKANANVYAADAPHKMIEIKILR